MANLRDIKKRISSVSSTKQITRTMEMVATAKIRRATDRVLAAEPYSRAMRTVLHNLRGEGTEHVHPLLEAHAEIQNVLFVVIASDRGLAGAFNTNVLHAAEKSAQAYTARGIKVEYILCGKKAIGFFSYRGVVPVMTFAGFSADPTLEEARQIASYVRHAYEHNDVDEVHVFYNHARNSADQDLRQEQILPVHVDDVEEAATPVASRAAASSSTDAAGAVAAGAAGSGSAASASVTSVDSPAGAASAEGQFEFEPSEMAVLGRLLPSYVTTEIYHALIDSASAEQGSRRKAMKSATDNATEIIKNLQRIYNRARQGAITTEISEIVGGAAALKEEE